MDILPQLLLNALISGSIYALAAAGIALAYGLLRVMNFAHGHMMMAGAYAFYAAKEMWGWGYLPSGLFGCVFSVVLAFFTLQIFVRPFLDQNVLLPFVTTLALSNMLESAVSMIFGVNVKSLYPGESAQSIEFYGIYITKIQIIIILSAIFVLGIAAFFIHLSSFGRKIRGLAEHHYVGEAMGISAYSVQMIVIISSVILASFAGILVGYEMNIQPTMGSSYTIKAFAAMVLGGLGNLWGTILGSYILGLIENLAIGLSLQDIMMLVFYPIYGPLGVIFPETADGIRAFVEGLGASFQFEMISIPAGYKDAFAFFIILLVLLFRPQGLFLQSTRKS